MKVVREGHLFYIAGIIDGEGYIGLIQHRKKKSLNFGYSPKTSVTNTNTTLLYWLKQETGIGVVTPQSKVEGCKPRWEWRLNADEMREFLVCIEPFLLIKKQQAVLLLEYLPFNFKGQRQVPDEISIQRECIYQELAALNARGDSR